MTLTTLTSNNITLHPLSVHYIESYLAALSEKILALLAISSLEAERTYLLQRVAEPTFFYCAFETKSKNFVGALEIRPTYYRSQLYNWINEQFWGNGYYQELLAACIPHYFKNNPQELHIQARIDITNLRSYYALKKFGFKDTGIFSGPRGDQYELIITQ